MHVESTDFIRLLIKSPLCLPPSHTPAAPHGSAALLPSVLVSLALFRLCFSISENSFYEMVFCQHVKVLQVMMSSNDVYKGSKSFLTLKAAFTVSKAVVKGWGVTNSLPFQHYWVRSTITSVSGWTKKKYQTMWLILQSDCREKQAAAVPAKQFQKKLYLMGTKPNPLQKKSLDHSASIPQNCKSFLKKTKCFKLYCLCNSKVRKWSGLIICIHTFDTPECLLDWITFRWHV